MRHISGLLGAGLAVSIALSGCGSSSSAASKAPAGTTSAIKGCGPLQKIDPSLKGRTLVDAITPFTPGYEAADPSNPGKYVGFDIDLITNLGKCLGFSVTYKSVAFSALLPTLQSGQANVVVSDIYATKQRAKAANFITYLRVHDGVLVKKGDPKHLTGINTSLCGATAAENTGFVEVPLVQAEGSACRAEGKPAPKLLLFSNNADCIQAVLAGRADAYINDVNTVEQAVTAHPGALAKAAAVTLPYSVGIAVPKTNQPMTEAFYKAVATLQKDGIESKMVSKWGLSQSQIQPPQTVK